MNKKIFFAIPFIFVLCCLLIVGCTETTSKTTITATINNMTKVTETLDKVNTIETSELIIDDFMNENQLTPLNNIIDDDKDNKFNTYFSNISSLNNNIISTVDLNNSINSLKQQLFAKASYVKTICSQMLEFNEDLTNNQIKTINEINSSISANSTRISMTRNEVSNNLKNVNQIKSEYSSKTNQLSSRYTKLKGSLNTRFTNYTTLFNSLDELSIILTLEKPVVGDYIFEDEKTTESVKTGITKNIDTYENAGTNIYGDYRNNPMYNPDNYLKNYNPGYGMNGYGNYGYNMMPNYGFANNGYGFGCPYGYGIPYNGDYLYPNINTFGSYKNIDTYRSKHKLNQKQNENSNNNVIEHADINLPNPPPKPKPMLDKNNSLQMPHYQQNDEQEDKFVDNQEEPKIKKIQENN